MFFYLKKPLLWDGRSKDYFKNTQASERKHAYFERMLELTYVNPDLKQRKEELKAKDGSLKAKLEKAYEFMKQFPINGVNVLEQFLRNIGVDAAEGAWLSW